LELGKTFSVGTAGV